MPSSLYINTHLPLYPCEVGASAIIPLSQITKLYIWAKRNGKIKNKKKQIRKLKCKEAKRFAKVTSQKVVDPRAKAPPFLAPPCSCCAAFLSWLMPGSYRFLSLHEPDGSKCGHSSLYFFKVLRLGKFVMSLIKGGKIREQNQAESGVRKET